MKIVIKLYALFIAIFMSSVAFATHNRAGEIRVVQVSALKIEATIITYTNSASIPADRNELTINWGDNKSEMIQRTKKELSADKTMYINYYTSTHSYLRSGRYTVWLTDPARNEGILNINFPYSSSVFFHIQTSFTLFETLEKTNATPVLDYLVSYGVVNQPFTYQLKAIDSDGDSIAYRLTTPMESLNRTVPNYQTLDKIRPNDNNKLSFDEKEGIFTWKAPQQGGDYSIAIQVISYRNGVAIDTTLRDMMITVLATTTDVKNIDNQGFVKIIPNPVSTEGVIEFDKILSEKTALTVYDVTGRIVKRDILDNVKRYTFNRREYEQGMYFFNFKNKNIDLTRKVVFE